MTPFLLPSSSSGEAESSPFLFAAEAERAAVLGECVAELTEADRRVVLLHHIAGIPLAVMAEMAGVTGSTMCWRHKQALARLRRRLAVRGIREWGDL